MKVIRFFGILLFSVCLLSTQSCQDEPMVIIPVSQKILGLWKQTEAMEEGFVVQLDPYHTINFSSDNTAVIKEFDANDVETDSTNDIWELTNSNTIIDFDVETDLEIVEITETQLIVKYQGPNQIGQQVEKQDTYTKQ